MVEVKTFTSAFRIAINQWYPVVVSIRVSEKFAQDREDGILDMANYKWPGKKIWHAICIQKIWEDIYFIDSRRDQKKYKIPSMKRLEESVWLMKFNEALIIKNV